jgi:hypothetical protein
MDLHKPNYNLLGRRKGIVEAFLERATEEDLLIYDCYFASLN